MIYEFNVHECGIHPPSMRDALPDYKLEPDRCFYIVSAGKYGKGSELVLTVDDHDKSHGWGIYDISVGHWEGAKSNNVN
mgnify:CR=1 FL=1